MRHFDITQWTDFVRRTVGGAERAEMTAHLESGCSSCRHTVDLLGEVVEMAAEEASLQPPDHALRSARALLALHRPERARRLTSLVLELAYDSSREPAAAGVRRAPETSRQLVYYAENYALSLRLDHELDKDRVLLGGEILDRQSEPVAAVPAVLLGRSGLVGHSVSDRLGEFHLRFPAGSEVRLCLLVSDSECLDVALEAIEPAAASEPRSAGPEGRETLQ